MSHIVLLKIVVLQDFDKHFKLQYFNTAIQSLLPHNLVVVNHFVVDLTQFTTPFMLFYF
jgi:hypothetical protein